MKHYFVLDKRDGTTKQIDPAKVDGFFEVVRQVTGRLDAKALLNSGHKIDVPDYTFTAEDVNPFKPVRIPLPWD